MTAAQEPQKRFRTCMLLFIAPSDEMRLSTIEILTEEALDRRRTPDPIHSEQYGLDINEITRRTSLSRPTISRRLKILKDADIVGVYQKGTINYYYLTPRKSDRQLMGLGYRLERFLY